MTSSFKDRVLEATDIKEVISDYVSLQSYSRYHRGLCPFHAEKTPSFYIYPDHFHCFGCHEHGDVIHFVMKHLRMEFIDALKWLARRAGLDDSELNSNQHRLHLRRQQSTRQLYRDAQAFFSHHLWQSSAPSKKARDYLLSRGFDKTFLQNHGFGYAPDGGMDTYKHLMAKGHSEKQLLSASLISQGSSHGQSQVYDFFRHRVILPIFDHQGSLIAFSGRVVENQENQIKNQAKYKNSRYAKNQILYGYHWAKDAMQAKKRAIVTEGYMDTLTLKSAGFVETVACQGTALSREHLKALSRYASSIILLFDGDTAGEAAALRVLPLTFPYPHMNFHLVRLPSGHDPDSFLRAYSKADLEHLISSAPPLFSSLMEQKVKSTDPENLLSLVEKQFLPWIHSLQDPLQKDILLRELAEHSGLSHGSLVTKLADSPKRPASNSSVGATSAPKLVKPEPIWWELLAQLYFAHPDDHLSTSEIREFLAASPSLDPYWLDLMSGCLQALESGAAGSSAPLPSDDLKEALQNMTAKYATDQRQAAIKQIMLTHQMSQLASQIDQLKVLMKREKDQQNTPSDHWTQLAHGIKELRSQYLSLYQQSRELKKASLASVSPETSSPSQNISSFQQILHSP